MPNPRKQVRHPLPRLKLLAGSSVLLLALSCGGGGGGSTPPQGGGINGQAINVGASGNFFSPKTLTVKAGTAVTFVWVSSGHSLVFGGGCAPATQGPSAGVNSGGVQNAGFQLSVPLAVISTPGSYPYYCSPHCGSDMTGTLTIIP